MHCFAFADFHVTSSRGAVNPASPIYGGAAAISIASATITQAAPSHVLVVAQRRAPAERDRVQDPSTTYWCAGRC